MVWLAEIVEFVRRTRFARRPVPLGQWWPIESQPLHTTANPATLLPLYEGATAGVEYATTADIDLATDWSSPSSAQPRT
jgi:hypothetical protein